MDCNDSKHAPLSKEEKQGRYKKRHNLHIGQHAPVNHAHSMHTVHASAWEALENNTGLMTTMGWDCWEELG
jgi:hypothetical protein